MYTLEEITNFMTQPIEIFGFAPENDLMDHIILITGNMNGYNVSYLEFSNTIEQFDLIKNVDVNNLNEALELSDIIFGEKSNWIDNGIEYNRCKGHEEDFERYLGHKNNYNNIEVAVMITRFKDSNHWLQFFIELGAETELALHSSYVDTISHLTLYFTAGECS